MYSTYTVHSLIVFPNISHKAVILYAENKLILPTEKPCLYSASNQNVVKINDFVPYFFLTF